jgi:hypothetical protein
VPVLIAAPLVFAVGEVWSLHGAQQRNLQEIAGGALATASKITAFEAFGHAIQSSLPFVLLAVAGIASQSLAGENSRGTLRNLLLRPLRRSDAVIGKASALLGAALVSFALVAAGAFAASSRWFAWEDVVEILVNGQPFPIAGGEASKMWPELGSMLASLLPALAAFAGVGFLAGAIARSGAAGLGAALGGALVLQALRVPAQLLGVEGWLPTAHVPLPGADDSAVRAFIETTQVQANAHDPFRGLHVVVPLAWAAMTFLAAALILRRRSIR